MLPVSDSADPAQAAMERPVLAELDRFDRILRESDSATTMLTDWMRARSGRNTTTSLVARRLRDEAKIIPDQAMIRRLKVEGPADLAWRRVRLMDGRRVLSDARNIYVPARLTEAMRRLLEETDIPFGTVIASLAPTRETLEVERYWPGDGGDVVPASRRLPARLLRHDALVRDAQGRPLCAVSEVYTRNILL